MKKLFLLRHGKASAPSSSQKDIERPLNKKGVAQINQVGLRLDEVHRNIDQIIYSAAKRTAETAEVANHFLSISNLVSDENLYLADEFTILTFLKKNAEANEVLYVGHNFGISNFASELAGHSVSMTTGMLIEFHIDIEDWEALGSGNSKLVSTFAPNVMIP